MSVLSLNANSIFPKAIRIGYEGENVVTQIDFNLKTWIAKYGMGGVTLLVLRHGDRDAYPVPLMIEDGVASWLITKTDTAKVGRGAIQLKYVVGEKVKKSPIFDVICLNALDDSDTVPDPYDSWLATLTDLSALTTQNAQSATQSAAQAAESAQTASEKADSITGLTAQATTLPEGASATASYHDGVLTIGIPKGDTGLTGPQGERGEQGPKGDTGLAGPQGPKGDTGLTGPKGDTGETRPKGDKGDKGDTGPEGPQGEQGPKGDKGDTGETGPKGDTGTQGPRGEQGPKGDKGDTGVVDASAIYPFLPTDTASGAIASFTDGADNVPVKDLVVGIEPVQDLHGYDSPWPAGGGKNKWSEADPSYTGTKNYEFDAPIMLANHTYTISATLEIDNPEYTTAIIFYGNRSSTGYASNLYFSEGVTSKTFTPSIDIDKLSFYATGSEATNPGVSATWTHFQIEEGSTATAYAPYSNICPISGWTATKVTRTGRNLLSLSSVELGGTNPRTKSVSIDTIPSGEYRFSAVNSGTSTGYFGVQFFNNTTLVGATYATSQNVTLTDTAKRVYVYMSREDYSNGKTFVLSEIQLELGSTATDYEPYSGQTYDITFPTEAGTVYGGTLDVTSGELVVDRAQIASYNGEALPSTWISDRDVYASGTTPTIGAQVVYKLATPITIDLTPQQITTLLGTNNIWSDAGYVTVEYKADIQEYIKKMIAEAVS